MQIFRETGASSIPAAEESGMTPDLIKWRIYASVCLAFVLAWLRSVRSRALQRLRSGE
jgi:hypothetical protein